MFVVGVGGWDKLKNH